MFLLKMYLKKSLFEGALLVLDYTWECFKENSKEGYVIKFS